MSKLDLDLVKYLKLSKVNSIEQVRQKVDAYAVNPGGKLIAVSFAEKTLKKLILDQECTELEYLYASENPDLSHIDFRIPLKKLVILNLSRCNLQSIDFPEGCENLSEIHLRRNALTRISFSGLYPKLWNLDLSNNQLSEFQLPVGSNLNDHLYLLGNNLNFPPQEIAEQGAKAVLKYFAALEEEKANEKPPVFLNEIKILLVGEGMAGKTSLLKQLAGKPFDKNESQTHGVNIEVLNLEELPVFENFKALKDVKARCWDFGGQEIMHASHQFFLTHRSIYILVIDSRTDARKDYWLKHIEKFGGGSQALVVVNKIDENKSYSLPQKAIEDKYNFIHRFFRVSCKKGGEGIQDLKESLAELIPTTDLFKSPIPHSWLEIKNQLEQETAAKKYIDQDRFFGICRENRVNDSSTQAILLQFLHDLGLVLHFKKLELKDFYVLDPHWVTIGVYKIINSHAIEHGFFTEEQLDFILNEEEQKKEEYDPAKNKLMKYSPGEQTYLVSIMKQFELLYETAPGCYLVPDLLAQEPMVSLDFPETEDTLHFVLTYDFLHNSVISRFILRMHDDLLDRQKLWRTGAILYNKTTDCTACFKANLEERRIDLLINGSGKAKRDYLAILRNTLGGIHEDFQDLGIKEWIPLQGHKEELVSYQELLGLEKMGKETYTSGKLLKDFPLPLLLDKIATKQDREMERERKPGTQITIHGSVGRIITDPDNYHEAETPVITPPPTPSGPKKWYETHLAKALFIGLPISLFVYYLLRKYLESPYAFDAALGAFMIITLYFWLRFSNSKRRFYRAAAFVFGTIALINTLPFLSVELAFKQKLEQSNLDFLVKLGLQDNPVLNVVLVGLVGFLYWLDSGKE